MSSSLLLQQSPAYLVRLSWMVSETEGKWPHYCCFVECCFQDSFKIARNILLQFPSSFFFSLYILSASTWCIRTVVLTQPVLGRNLIGRERERERERIHRLFLCRGVRFPKQESWIWLETIWWRSSSKAGTLQNVVAPDRVLSMS